MGNWIDGSLDVRELVSSDSYHPGGCRSCASVDCSHETGHGPECPLRRFQLESQRSTICGRQDSAASSPMSRCLGSSSRVLHALQVMKRFGYAGTPLTPVSCNHLQRHAPAAASSPAGRGRSPAFACPVLCSPDAVLEARMHPPPPDKMLTTRHGHASQVPRPRRQRLGGQSRAGPGRAGQDDHQLSSSDNVTGQRGRQMRVGGSGRGRRDGVGARAVDSGRQAGEGERSLCDEYDAGISTISILTTDHPHPLCIHETRDLATEAFHRQSPKFPNRSSSFASASLFLSSPPSGPGRCQAHQRGNPYSNSHHHSTRISPAIQYIHRPWSRALSDSTPHARLPDIPTVPIIQNIVDNTSLGEFFISSATCRCLPNRARLENGIWNPTKKIRGHLGTPTFPTASEN